MVVNLIKSKQMFSLTLPQKIKGQFWLTDTDEKGRPRQLVSIEASQDGWIAKSNKLVCILDEKNQPVQSVRLTTQSFHYLRLTKTEEVIVLFTEKLDSSRLAFSKILVSESGAYTIGRNTTNHICVNNGLVSGNHAVLTFDGNNWMITDSGSTNGTFVNGFRVTQQHLQSGDFIYIMGLKIIIGSNYFAINNPDNMVQLNGGMFYLYTAQAKEERGEIGELPDKKYFYKPPRFFREVEHVEIKIDPPPQLQKMETVPLALMLGPSITMAMTSVSTGFLTLNNVLASGGNISQALPTLIMSVSMLLGTVMWPILTKKYEKKEKIKFENKRQTKYLSYLDEIRDEIKRVCKEQRDILNENIASFEECNARINRVQTNLWERLPSHSDFLRIRLGLGNIQMDGEVKFPEKRFTLEDDSLQDAMFALGNEPKQLQQVPITVSMTEEKVVGIYGRKEQTFNSLKSMIVQMATLHGYDDMKMILIVDKEDETAFDFVKCIPHFWNDEKTVRYFASTQDEVKELSIFLDKIIEPRTERNNATYKEFSPYYVIISTSKQLAEKCEALQQLLTCEKNIGFSILSLADELKDIPKEAEVVISINGENSKIFDKNDTDGKAISFAADRIDESVLNALAEKLANIELDLSSQRYLLPNMMTFLEMFHVSKIEHLNILNRWKENNPTVTLQTPVGVDTAGNTFNLDLHEKYHGPHGLVAGMTGSGKSEFIITYILSLAVNFHPDEVSFILIDYKGGGLTGAFENEETGMRLPHLAGTITNLDGAAVKRSLISIQSELRRRQSIFNEARKIANEGTMDIYKYQQLYRDKVVTEAVPHLFIISDEFAELKAQQPEFMEQLISAARIGRSLGVHLILATQKPNGVVDDQIWSNSKFRVCLKVQEKADSQDMIKCPDAAEISQTGRFYLQVGFNELFALGQSAWSGAEYIPSDTIEKKVDESIQVIDNLGRVMMNVKPNKKKIADSKKVKQIVSVVQYLSDLAEEEHIHIRPLWLPPISPLIYVDDLEAKYGKENDGYVLNPIVGEYDDPFNQQQFALRIPLSRDGNCLVYGSTGNGKTTFLSAFSYSLIKNHTPEEVNLYIMDFGSETLKVFEKAPHVGDVVLSADNEKILNLFKMLQSEIQKRKTIFAEYGGDYLAYCKKSGKTVPNIVILVNNYSGFAEQYEELIEEFSLLSRDGVKFGVYFVVTASSTNAVRYKTAQNFKTMLSMQLNDATDYVMVVGKTDGLVPSKYKGRGLVQLDKVYEFQTAYCAETEDQSEFLRQYSKELCKQYSSRARKIPVLPKQVDYEFVADKIDGLKQLPIGVAKKSLCINSIDLEKKVVYPVVAQDVYQMTPFLEEFGKAASSQITTIVLDVEKLLAEYSQCVVIDNAYEAFVQQLFKEMVERNNVYKDANLDLAALEPYDERLYIIVGIKKLFDMLSADGKEKLGVLIEKAEAIYKLHFIVAESVTSLNAYAYEAWYKRHITGADGLWIGDGVADQYLLKINKVTSELYEDIGNDYGYALNRNRPTLIKLLSSSISEEE